MSWDVVYTKQAQKDAKKLSSAGLKDKAKYLINIQHRLVYQVYENENTIKVIRLWTHYQ